MNEQDKFDEQALILCPCHYSTRLCVLKFEDECKGCQFRPFVAAALRAQAWDFENQLSYERERNTNNVAIAGTQTEELKTSNAELKHILAILREELDNYSDVLDDGRGGVRPNTAMRILQFLDEKLAAIDRERGK